MLVFFVWIKLLNNILYVGMPSDITKTEFADIMSKCGIIATNPVTNEQKLKLYMDSEGNPKGDGLCCYLKVIFFDIFLVLFFFTEGVEVTFYAVMLQRIKSYLVIYYLALFEYQLIAVQAYISKKNFDLTFYFKLMLKFILFRESQFLLLFKF